MRYTQRCPKCSGQKFAVTELRDKGYDHAVPVITFFEDGLLQVHGSFETWICLGCGYAEFYAHNCLLPFDTIAKQHPDRLRIVDATPPDQGPYR
jgi:predicted nucleic-acid-binding Zn-ribbon protein